MSVLRCQSSQARGVDLPPSVRCGLLRRMRTAARSPWVTPQRVIGRDLDEHDTYAVRILDPHLDQPPRLWPGFTRDLHSRRHETLVLGSYVTDLQPDPKRSGWLTVGCTGYLQQSLAQEEH